MPQGAAGWIGARGAQHRARPVQTLLGRASDLASVLALLDRARLVTIVAPGGAGKTALAVAAAAAIRESGDEAWVIDFAAAVDLTAMNTITARALGLEVAGEDADAAVTGYLSTRAGLLVADTLEDVQDAGAWAERLLAAAPAIRMLAASRRPLHTRSEHELPLAGLDLPADATVEAVEAAPSSALFLRHARRLGRLETLDPVEAAAVAELVARLDGMPLGIELAAGRTRLLRPSRILERLDDPDLLARTGASDGNDRHASLSVVIDWSIGLLIEEHARVLRAIAVCPSSVDVELVGALVPDVSPVAALDAALTAGLLSRVPDRDDQFRMLDTVRAHISRRINPDDEAVVMGRLAGYVAGQAATLGPALWEPGGHRSPASRLEDTREVLTAGIAWDLDHEPGRALTTLADLRRFWVGGSDLATPISWVRRALASTDHAHPARPMALALLVRLLARYEGGEAAVALEAEALEAAERDGSPAVRRLTYSALAMAQYARGDLAAVGALQLRAADVVGNADARASFEHAGRCSLERARGDHEAALRQLRHAVQAEARHDDALNQSIQLATVALLELRLGRPSAAVVAARESHALNPRGQLAASALCMLAMGLAGIRRPGEAAPALADAWAQTQYGALVDRLDVLEAGVPLLVEGGDDALALTVLAASDAIRPATGWARAPEMAWILARHGRRARRRAGTVAAAAAVRDAAGLRIEPLMERVLTAAASPPRSTATRAPVLEELTPREAEVLALLAAGRSDREIGAALGMSPKTASVHIGRIKGKLGASSRVDLALRAHGLGRPPRRGIQPA